MIQTEGLRKAVGHMSIVVVPGRLFYEEFPNFS